MLTTDDTFQAAVVRGDRIVIASPCDTRVLIVSRDGVVVADTPFPSPSKVAELVTCVCVVGVAGPVVLVATRRRLAGTIQRHKVWRITHARVLTFLDDHVAAAQSPELEALTAAYLSIINAGHLYYSQNYDLSHSMQHHAGRLRSQDSRYFFNHALMQPLLALSPNSPSSIPWVTPLICGFVGSIDVTVAPEENVDVKRVFTVTLIFRLSTRRLGARYLKRGLNRAGHAANTVEMEQIVFDHNLRDGDVKTKIEGVSSFVQIRGSAPLIWSQPRNLAYKSPIQIVQNSDSLAASFAHFNDLLRQYDVLDISQKKDPEGKILCVNLLDEDGHEEHLTKAYERAVKSFNNSQVIYEGFSVNKWCRNFDFSNMSILMERAANIFPEMGVFVGTGSVASNFGVRRDTPPKFATIRKQIGVIRTSCLDSLDRTNLACTMFAQYFLSLQIHALVCLTSRGVVRVPPLETALGYLAAQVNESQEFKRMWADAGDAASILYAGTRALRGDIVRTIDLGTLAFHAASSQLPWSLANASQFMSPKTAPSLFRRVLNTRAYAHGRIDDAVNSLTRYYLNTHVDGRRQDAWDAWTRSSERSESFADVWRRRAILQRRRARVAAVVRVLCLFTQVAVVVEPLVWAAVCVVRAARARVSHAFALIVSRTPPAVSVEPEMEFTLSTVLFALPKSYAPEEITNFVQFAVAMLCSIYLYIAANLLGVHGGQVVDNPMLLGESSA
ncbi:Phosphoinositide phosphatase sac1 [Entophlyctis luteolus]|nr:Phosphoinositide phosphatase sac1 [Entophlyctis luteolus]